MYNANHKILVDMLIILSQNSQTMQINFIGLFCFRFLEDIISIRELIA